MTETTEGLTRRMSSGSDSPSARAVAAVKKKKATSASHGGSLRFNISGAFFSKKEFGVRGFQRLRRGGVQRTKPNCSRPRLSTAAFGHYAAIHADVNSFMSKLCHVWF